MGKNYFEMIRDGILVDGSGGGDAPAPVLIEKSVTANGTYSASDDSADGYSTVSVSVPNTYGAGDEGKVVSNGALVAQGSDSVTENGTVDTTLISSLTVNVSGGGIELQPQQTTKTSMNPVAKPFFYRFISKSWNGSSNFYGSYTWTDGDNIYYSNGSSQYVLNKSTSTWSTKTWNGLTNFYGDYIWTDGDNIYYSSSSSQYVLYKSTSTWSAKIWSGLTNFDGNRIWADGDNIYYSGGSNSTQYVLNKSTRTWSTKTWNGLTSFRGSNVWSDGDNIYYSSSTDQYVLTLKYGTEYAPSIRTTSCKVKFT